MHRREFLAHTAGAIALATPLSPAFGQSTFVAGKDYRAVNPPATKTVAGKIEVLAFFTYRSPGCNVFEPLLAAWEKKLPADVVLKRIPVEINPSDGLLQNVYYAIEALHARNAHSAVYAEFHVNKKSVWGTRDEAITFLSTTLRMDKNKVSLVFNSFQMTSSMKQGNQIARGYLVSTVPSVGVNGKFLIAPPAAGSPGAMLSVADHLIAQERKPA